MGTVLGKLHKGTWSWVAHLPNHYMGGSNIKRLGTIVVWFQVKVDQNTGDCCCRAYNLSNKASGSLGSPHIAETTSNLCLQPEELPELEETLVQRVTCFPPFLDSYLFTTNKSKDISKQRQQSPYQSYSPATPLQERQSN